MTRVQSWHEASRNVFSPQCLSGVDKQPSLIPLSLLVWGFSTSWTLGTFTGLLLKSSGADGKRGEATLCGRTLTNFEMLIKIQWTRQAWTELPPPPCIIRPSWFRSGTPSPWPPTPGSRRRSSPSTSWRPLGTWRDWSTNCMTLATEASPHRRYITPFDTTKHRQQNNLVLQTVVWLNGPRPTSTKWLSRKLLSISHKVLGTRAAEKSFEINKNRMEMDGMSLP